MTTRTGNFPIGFRRGWSDWQSRDLATLAQWAKASGFEAMDLGQANPKDLQILKDDGLRLGTVDLLDFGQLTTSDAAKKNDLIAQNVSYVKEAAGLGAKVFFTIVPGDDTRSRSENYKLAVESFAPIVDAVVAAGAALAIEGWPGGGSILSNLCCTPETYRSFIKDLGGKGVGINYDPSHLVRLGVDHIRFLKEFVPYVTHVHAKDTEIDSEAIYEYGLYQSSAFAKAHDFGEWVWRYTIPGHGCVRWGEAFRILKENHYAGAVSIELEDENFNGSEEGEKSGLIHGLNFLQGV